jgi:hypothetical protein
MGDSLVDMSDWHAQMSCTPDPAPTIAVLTVPAGHYQPAANGKHQCIPHLGHRSLTRHCYGVQHESQRQLIRHHGPTGSGISHQPQQPLCVPAQRRLQVRIPCPDLELYTSLLNNLCCNSDFLFQRTCTKARGGPLFALIRRVGASTQGTATWSRFRLLKGRLGYQSTTAPLLVHQLDFPSSCCCYSVKLAARVGTSGIDGELGLSRRFSPTSVVYAGTVLGFTSGTQFKLRYSRAGQVCKCSCTALHSAELGMWLNADGHGAGFLSSLAVCICPC